MKKGVELALNTIVIAAIVLLVLLVTILIITGHMSGVIDSFRNLGNQATGKAKCTVVLPDPSIDKDADGYHDTLTYQATYKVDGKKIEVDCLCDTDPNNPDVHGYLNPKDEEKNC